VSNTVKSQTVVAGGKSLIVVNRADTISHLDGMCFQMFLDQLAETYPAHLNVIQLDNGKFHQSSRLKIPDNILLIFQPPYSPELNPIERIWSHIKQEQRKGNL